MVHLRAVRSPLRHRSHALPNASPRSIRRPFVPQVVSVGDHAGGKLISGWTVPSSRPRPRRVHGTYPDLWPTTATRARTVGYAERPRNKRLKLSARVA